MLHCWVALLFISYSMVLWCYIIVLWCFVAFGYEVACYLSWFKWIWGWWATCLSLSASTNFFSFRLHLVVDWLSRSSLSDTLNFAAYICSCTVHLYEYAIICHSQSRYDLETCPYHNSSIFLFVLMLTLHGRHWKINEFIKIWFPVARFLV